MSKLHWGKIKKTQFSSLNVKFMQTNQITGNLAEVLLGAIHKIHIVCMRIIEFLKKLAPPMFPIHIQPSLQACRGKILMFLFSLLNRIRHIKLIQGTPKKRISFVGKKIGYDLKFLRQANLQTEQFYQGYLHFQVKFSTEMNI